MDQSIDRLLYAYFSGTANSEDQDMILSWLKESEEHEAHYKECCEIWALQHLQDLADNKNMVHLNILNKLVDKQGKPHRRIWMSLGRIAAIFVLGVIIGFASILYFNKPVSVNNNDESYTETMVPNGARSKLRLPDGSTVWLNAGSRLIYQNDFNKNNRTVSLDGEGFFDVHKSSIPFIVTSGAVQVKAVGTSFNVCAYSSEKTIETTLINGKVVVTNTDQQELAEGITLLPNQKLIISRQKTGPAILKEIIDPNSDISWIKGEFRFKEMTLEDIAKRLERNFNVTFVFEDNLLKDRRLTGTFYNYQSIENILKAMKISIKQLSYRIEKDMIYIRYK